MFNSFKLSSVITLTIIITIIGSCSLFDSNKRKGSRGLPGIDSSSEEAAIPEGVECGLTQWWDGSDCVDCPVGSSPVSSGTSCVCATGVFDPSTNACADCDVGERRTTVSGVITCVPCPTNSTSSTDHSTCICNSGYGTFSPTANQCIVSTTNLLRLYADNATSATTLDFGEVCPASPDTHILKIDKTLNIMPVNLVFLSLSTLNNSYTSSSGFKIRTMTGSVPYNVNVDTNYSLPIYSNPVPLAVPGGYPLSYKLSFEPSSSVANGTIVNGTVTAKVNDPNIPGSYLTKQLSLKAKVNCVAHGYKFDIKDSNDALLNSFDYQALQSEPTADLLRISAGLTRDFTLTVTNIGSKQIKIKNMSMCTGTTNCTPDSNFSIVQGVYEVSTGDVLEPSFDGVTPGDSEVYSFSFTSPSPATTSDTVFNANIRYQVEYLNELGVLTTDNKKLMLKATRPMAGVAYKISVNDYYATPQEKLIFDTQTSTSTLSFDCGTFISGDCNFNAYGSKMVTVKIENIGSDPLEIPFIGLTGASTDDYFYGCSGGYSVPVSQNDARECSLLCKCPPSNVSALVNNFGNLQVTLNSTTHDIQLKSTWAPSGVYSLTVGGEAIPIFDVIMTSSTPPAAVSKTLKLENLGATPITLNKFAGTTSGVPSLSPGAFNISNCNIYTQSGSITGSPSIPASIPAYGSYRCTMTATANTTLTSTSWNFTYKVGADAEKNFKVAAQYRPRCTGTTYSIGGYSHTATGGLGCSSCSTTVGTSQDYHTGRTLNITCYDPSVGGCFKKGTKVRTPKGDVNIEDVKVGDIVMSYDDIKKKIVENKVKEVLVHKDFKDPATILTLEDGSKTYVTKKHPYYSPADKKFKHLKEFKVGDKVLVQKDGELKELGIKGFKDQGFFDVEYNLHLSKGPHTYFANGAVVHNAQYTGEVGTGGIGK